MKSAVIFFLFALIAIAACNEDFARFVKKINKVFVSKGHRERALKHYEIGSNIIKDNNLKFIKKQSLVKLSHNKYSTLNEQEWKALQIDFKKFQTPNTRTYGWDSVSKEVPPANWKPTARNLITDKIPIKHQSTCGSCWSFAATAIYEYKLLQTHNQYFDLSEQMCVDCARKDGCKGGCIYECLDYHIQNGCNYETVYPYVAKLGQCAYKDMSVNKANGLGKQFAGPWHTIAPNEQHMAYFIEKKGWIAACLHADNDKFRYYESGYIMPSECLQTPTHAIVLVGYGYDPVAKIDFWLGRNSWGTNWGIQGYFKLKRGVNACGIAADWDGFRVYLD